MRYVLKLSYCGAAFCGWQIQNDAPSVQQSLQDALSILLRQEISVTGAGRTDTGVNAIGYVAHFDSPQALDTDQMCYKLNAILPGEIVIDSISQVADDFHARFDATNREYTYFLHRVKDPFVENFSLFYPFSLDFDLMNRAAALMLGTHDFSCFEKVGADNKTSVCTVTQAGWHTYVPTHIALTGNGDCLSMPRGAAPIIPRGGRSHPADCVDGTGNGDCLSMPGGAAGQGSPQENHATLGTVRGRGPAARLGGVERSETFSGASPCPADSQSDIPDHLQGNIPDNILDNGNYWYFRIGANRFLRNMVRATVGTLIEVGRGKRSLDEFAALLEGGTRCDAGQSVPGKALFLSKIEY